MKPRTRSEPYSPVRSFIILVALAGFATLETFEVLTHGAWRDWDILRHQATAPGRISDEHEEGIDFDYTFTVDGKKYSGTDWVNPPIFHVGDVVDVYYSRQDPSHSGLKLPPSPLPVFGIIWGVVILAIIVDRRDKARKAKAQGGVETRQAHGPDA